MEKEKKLTVSAVKTGEKIVISIEGETPARIVLVNTVVASAEGAELTIEDGSTILNNVNKTITLSFQ